MNKQITELKLSEIENVVGGVTVTLNASTYRVPVSTSQSAVATAFDKPLSL
jgi:hypothetical protein